MKYSRYLSVKNYILILGLFVATLLIPGVANGITIEEVVATIEENNPGLLAIAAANEADIAEIRSENTLPPTSVEYSPFFRSGGTGLASSELIVSQEFEFPTIYSARNKAANAQSFQRLMAVATAHRNLRIEATQQCLALVNAYKQRDILKERIAVSDTLADLYALKLKRGASTKLEINKINISRQDLQVALLDNDVIIEETKASLEALNGGAPLSLDQLSYDTPLSGINLPTDLDQYTLNRPEVAEALIAINTAEADSKVIRQSMLPTISIGYRRNTELNESSNGFLVGISVPLFSIGKKNKAIQARKAAAEAEAEDAMIRTKAEATATLRRLEAIKSTIDACDIQLIKETIDLYLSSLKAGQITLTEYYLETDILYERLSTRARLEYEYRKSASEVLIDF